MSRFDKLVIKLQNGTISAGELRTLLKKMGWQMEENGSSHQQWWHPTNIYPNNRFTLATHTKDLKPYQIKEIIKKLGV